MNLVEELEWRGLVQDMTPGTKELFAKEKVKAYIGFDPTADSLHIGSLVPIIILMHLQRHGHTPFALVGGATGMVGDPTGKSKERNLLNDEELQLNLKGITEQLSHFLDFNAKNNPAEVVNNYDWFKEFSFLRFIRDVGKYITVNYMMAKDSVKQRFSGDIGISFTEFSYQLIQGYDFVHLYKTKGIKVQMGGSDQWGNITTGTELIRKMLGGEAYALTSPLVKKADGGKFGKTEQGNIWLDAERTSPYKFYQFWLNSSDEDAKNWIKVFCFFSQEETNALIVQHEEAPHLRILQKALAQDLTVRVHSQVDYENAVQASEVLFGKTTHDSLNQLEERTLLEIFDGVPTYKLDRIHFAENISVIDLLSVLTNVYSSKGEVKRALASNAIAINQDKVNEQSVISSQDIIKGKFLIVRKGKKDYHLIMIE
ncbi:MAG: tyrosine--tRNA ligase [Chitinophagales bacterium]|nr:tyrosine--tRNA ligase [Chitinophagales bacterium]MCZ2392652.1 tyrosine--tRNA ligase [Chitinophagales bacterium]